MERARQVVSVDGLQIPLPLMQRYGFQPGTEVVLELGADGIHVLSALPGRLDIEGKALRTLLRNLGDAVTIKVEKEGETWRVLVYGAEIATPLGELVYGLTGELLEDRSTPLEEMRRRAVGS